MSTPRYVVAALARARSDWLGALSRAVTAGALPVELLRCVSATELHARLRSGRPLSAVLVDGGLGGVDRDLLHTARRCGALPLVVADPHVRLDWTTLGAAAVLPATFDRAALLDALRRGAAPVADVARLPGRPQPGPARWRGRLVAVTGAPGSGTSTAAIALAQGLARRPGNERAVVLADACLDATQALLHDARDLAPGLPELVEAHRAGALAVPETRTLTFDVPDRGYHLLLGLRRRADWTALRPQAVYQAFEALRRAYRIVVADTDRDTEGVAECGSVDVEDRNTLARTVLGGADVVVATAVPTLGGLHGLGRTLGDLAALPVEPERVLVCVNQAPRSPRGRAELARVVAEVARGAAGAAAAGCLFLPARSRVEHAHRDGGPLPSGLANPLAGAVEALLADVPAPDAEPRPVPIAPGTLGVATGGALR